MTHEDKLDCALSGQSREARLIDSVSATLCAQAYDLRQSHTINGEWPESEASTNAECEMLLEMAAELRALKLRIEGDDHIAKLSKMVPMSLIALKKLDQMASEVCGVLVRGNSGFEAGAFAVIDEHGRVMRIDGFGGEA